MATSIKMIGWTVEERERYAFAVGSPLAPLLGFVAEAGQGTIESLQQQLEETKRELDDKIQERENKIAKLEHKMQQISILCAVTR